MPRSTALRSQTPIPKSPRAEKGFSARAPTPDIDTKNSSCPKGPATAPVSMPARARAKTIGLQTSPGVSSWVGKIMGDYCRAGNSRISSHRVARPSNLKVPLPRPLLLLEGRDAIGHVAIVDVHCIYLPETIERGRRISGRGQRHG